MRSIPALTTTPRATRPCSKSPASWPAAKRSCRGEILFIAFTGEERGLLGSAHYVRDPLFPLEKTIAMLNLDMVGRMQDNKLIVNSNDTSPQFDPLIDRVNEKYHFAITKQPGGFGPSDHASFYEKHIPVLFYFTGTHKDYHRPSDTADKINVPDMRRVAQMVADTAVAIAEAEQRPEFSESKAKARSLGPPRRPALFRQRSRFRPGAAGRLCDQRRDERGPRRGSRLERRAT